MNSLQQQTLALAAVIQAAAMVHKIAFTEKLDPEPFKLGVDSIFNNSITKVEELFTPEQLTLGLETLIIVLDTRALQREKLINRYWFALLYLASKLKKDNAMSQKLREQLKSATRQYEHFGATHESTLLRLGEVWQQTLGTYRFKILVIGNAPSLQNSLTAAKIRTCLLAGIRAGVLWDQLGGSQWHLFFKKKKIIEAAQALLRERTRTAESV